MTLNAPSQQTMNAYEVLSVNFREYFSEFNVGFKNV
jgi:hypothetical protein